LNSTDFAPKDFGTGVGGSLSGSVIGDESQEANLRRGANMKRSK